MEITSLYLWLSVTTTRGKVVHILPYHEGTSRNGGTDPCILNLGTRWRSKPQSVYFQGKNPNTCCKGDWVEPTVSLDTLEKRKVSCPCWPSILKPHHYTDSMLKPFPQVFLALCLVLLAKCSHGTSRFASSSYLLSFNMTYCQASLKQYTRWFKYDRDWFVCKQAALRSSCATLREWSHNLHPPSCLG